MTRTIALVCLFLVPIAVVGSAEERTWTDTTGRSMKAEFLRLEGTDVVFRKEGKEVTVPLSRLSPQDRDAVNALSEQGDSENPFEVQAVDNPFEVVGDEKDSPASPSDEADKRQRVVQRVWTDAQGRQFKAKFVRINGLNVVLNRAGRIAMVPYYTLSQADQDYVAELLKGRGEEDKVPPPSARSNEGDDTTGSSLGVGSGGSPGMLGSSGSFPGGMPGGTPGVRYPSGGLSSGGLSSGGVPGAGLRGSMPSLPPMPSGMPGVPGGSSFPGGPPPSGYPGSSPSPGRGGSGYPGSLPGSMPSAGGYPGGSSSPPGMAGGSSPAMGTGSSFPGSSFPGSSSPSYPSTLGGPHGSSSTMGSGSSAMGGPSGMPGMGGPYGGSGPPMPDLPRFEFVYTCSQCNREFSEAQSKGKTHCPSCGVAWLNQGGTAGTFNKSAPQYNSKWGSYQTTWRTRSIVKLVVAVIAFLFSVLGGGATAYSRWNKS